MRKRCVTLLPPLLNTVEVKILLANLEVNTLPAFGVMMKQLPRNMQEGIQKYKFESAQLEHCTGRFLLGKLFEQFDLPFSTLQEVKQTELRKLYIDHQLSVNISHSANMVACAGVLGVELGVDIEKIRDINFENFESKFNPHEWDYILTHYNPYEAFFEMWTKKESVMKADGRGIGAGLTNISITGNTAHVQDTDSHWELFPQDWQEGYKACVCLPSGAAPNFTINKM